jgi:protoheme IX farnesyltransferase
MTAATAAPPALPPPPVAVIRRGPMDLLRDYARLTKIRVTTLVVITAWCGFFFGQHKSALPVLTIKLLYALAGIGMVAAGTACMNEILERNSDALMQRTALRPMVTHSMSVGHALAVWAVLTTSGATLLAVRLNLLTSLLSLLTAATYLLIYTPLKKISPLCTFVGAFPGAMPGVLGWTAARGKLEYEALVLFAIVFFWQFPHFHAIALLYRDDYARAGIRMLPVVESDGRSTARQILMYGAALLPTTLAPTMLGMAGLFYFVGASVLGLGLFYFCARIWSECLPPSTPRSKTLARTLLKATVTYLPLLFALMMLNSAA